jgi:UDP-N-acetyl-alpha-D-muramoyl-L-alanyl-L-glutamate epimerase
MAALAASPDWSEDAIIERFRRVVLPHLDPAQLDLAALMQPAGEHGIPDALAQQIDAYFRA